VGDYDSVEMESGAIEMSDEDKLKEFEKNKLRVTRKIKSVLKHYLMNEYSFDYKDLEIHLIDAFEKSNKELIVVSIYLGKPGPFIGNKGSHIKHVENILTNRMGKEVTINLKEFDVFR
jgi:ribosomal protein S3